jgi:XRE family transcriptional regulator, fatty acid utilization regulator
MAQNAHLGLKVRRLRQSESLSQVEAATRLGISASYLNLIEHNQRPLTVNLLFKIGQLFDIDLRDWSEGDEARLASSIREVLNDPVLNDMDVPELEISEATIVVPALSHAITELYAAYRRSLNNVNTLGDRLSEQAAMSMASMEIRTVLTSIRSFSEILHEHEDLDETQRQQFLSILVDESDRLALMIEAAVTTADETRLQAMTGQRQPIEEISRFLERHNNHFSDLEAFAESITNTWGASTFDMPQRLRTILAEQYDIDVSFSPDDSTDEAYFIDPNRAPADVAMDLARLLGQALCGDAISEHMDQDSIPPTAAAHLEVTMINYFAAAMIMPYDLFYAAATASGYDLEHIARSFQVTPLMAARRLTTLRRPGTRGVPFHLLVIDIAGNVRERIPGSGMPLPRFGSSCPRWNVHQAFTNPGQMLIEHVELPDGGVYVGMSLSDTIERLAFSIGCAETQAGEVAAFGKLINGGEPASAVGVNCRICPRANCSDRAFDSLIDIPA